MSGPEAGTHLELLHRWREEDQEIKVKPVAYGLQGQSGTHDTLLKETERGQGGKQADREKNMGVQKRN